MNDVIVRLADAGDVPRIAPLFDAYRQFYRQPSDPERALRFLRERVERKESIVFVAERDRAAEPLGFAQVYPEFSSVRCARAWILNDLFVAPAARRLGVARILMRRVADEARRAGAAYVELATETNNANARALYESEGYERESGYEHYTLYIKA
jgi:ribosomal protein S18 acetylase RimI-like enzyme